MSTSSPARSGRGKSDPREGRLDAQAVILDKLVDALKDASNGSFDVEVLKREIRAVVARAADENVAEGSP